MKREFNRHVPDGYPTLGSGFGARIRTLRIAAGLTGEQLGRRVGRNQQYVSAVEHERFRPPGEVFDDIAQVLGCDASALAYGVTHIGELSEKSFNVARMYNALNSAQQETVDHALIQCIVERESDEPAREQLDLKLSA